MNWTELDTWIVLTAAFMAMACALPGVFLLLNRQSMLGDAISHGVLPGLAIAFLVTGSRAPWAMLLGAVIAGVLTGVLTQWVQRFGQVEGGASMGVVFCFLFALGLILIRTAADHVDLDPGCVLYGSIETAVVDVNRVPRIFWVSLLMVGVNVSLVALFYKELKIASFDPDLATSQGISAMWVRNGLTIVTAITTVMAFESVGSILVIAMMVAPAAAASLLSHRLSVILWLSLLLAGLSAVLGHLGAMTVFPATLARLGLGKTGATSTAGMMAVAAGGLFAVAFAWSLLKDRIRQRVGNRRLPA